MSIIKKNSKLNSTLSKINEDNKSNNTNNKHIPTISNLKSVKEITWTESPSLNIKIAILGDNKSGKSNLVSCFLNKSFDNFEYTEDIFKVQSKNLVINDILFEVSFYEISGNYERDNIALREYLQVADAYLICHSFDSPLSENKLKKWVSLISQMNVKKSPIYLVGCKYDIQLKESIQTNQMYKKDFAFIKDDSDEFNENYNPNKAFNIKLTFEDHIQNFITNNELVKYFYTSALMNINVDSMFDYILKNIIIENISKQKMNKIDIEEKYKCSIF